MIKSRRKHWFQFEKSKLSNRKLTNYLDERHMREIKKKKNDITMKELLQK